MTTSTLPPTKLNGHVNPSVIVDPAVRICYVATVFPL
jgi:hypothetical protein